MKKFLFVVLVSTVFFTSCKKEEFKPNQEVVEDSVEEGIILYGEWELVSGQMFIENLVTGEKIVYDHFGPNKTTSSLRYSGSEFEFETIEEGITTWTFIAPPNWNGYGEFWLDNDSIQPYGLYISDNNWSVVEDPTASTTQLGGSSRPLTAVVKSYETQTVEFRVQEAYESIGGQNCTYYSVLIFKKKN